jgi:hypothetical protein
MAKVKMGSVKDPYKSKKFKTKNVRAKLMTGETKGLRELYFVVTSMEHAISEGAISAGFKKLKDAPLLERMKFIHGENKKLDKKATQAAREAGAEERREK